MRFVDNGVFRASAPTETLGDEAKMISILFCSNLVKISEKNEKL